VVTYPISFPKTSQTMSQPDVKIPNDQHTLQTSPENEALTIINLPVTNPQTIEQTSPITEPTLIDQASNEAQHGSISHTIQDGTQQTP